MDCIMQNEEFVSFNGLNDVYRRNICESTKGRIRRAVVARDLAQICAMLPESPRGILDAGCGDGSTLRDLARMQDHVFALDVSSEAVDAARVNLAGLDAAVFQADILSLPSEILDRRYHLIICHALLEWIRDKSMALEILASLLEPDGVLSLLFYNRDALFFQTLIVGNFPYADSDLISRHRQKMTPPFPADRQSVTDLATRLGLEIVLESGVRVFHDYMRHKDRQIDMFEDVLRYELKLSRDPRFMHLGRYVHLALKRSGR